jgi:hypothetical protein
VCVCVCERARVYSYIEVLLLEIMTGEFRVEHGVNESLIKCYYTFVQILL